MVEPHVRSSPRKLLHGRSRSGASGASSVSSPPTTPRKRSFAKKASGGTKNAEVRVVSPALSYEDQQSLNRSQSSLGRKKRQKSKKRMNLWKKKKNATTFDGEDLKQLLDVVTTRMHATEGLTGQTLEEDQLLNIVRDVLESRQENDVNSSFSDHTSKNDEKTNPGDVDGAVAPDTSLHQLIVILMGLLLQQRNVGEVSPDGVPGAPDGVPGVVVAETDDLQKSNDSCSLITAPETKDTNSLVSMATDEQTHPPNEETDDDNGVEYTFEELTTMLSIIKAAHHEIEDDESSVWSNASTLEFLDNSFSDESSTLENVFEKFINMIPVPTLAGIVGQDDATLDPLEEEFSSDDETLDQSIGIETTSVGKKNVETAQDIEVETQDDAPSSSLFFGNIWGRSNECTDDALVAEDDAENAGLVEAVASTNPPPLIKAPDEPEGAETEPSFFSGMFDAKPPDSPRLNSEGSNTACFASEATIHENEKPHAGPAVAKETSIFSSISAMFTNPFGDNGEAEDGETSETVEDQQTNVDQTSLPSGDHQQQGGEASVACEETQCEASVGSTQSVDEETENQRSVVNSISDDHPNTFGTSDDESSVPFDEDDGDDEDDEDEKTYNTCEEALYLDQELGSDDELDSKEYALPVPACTLPAEQFAEGGKDNQLETTEIDHPMVSPDFIFDHICQADIYGTDFGDNTQTTVSTSPARHVKLIDESQTVPQSRKLELPRRSHTLDDAAEEGAWDRVEYTIDDLPQKEHTNEIEKENTDEKTVADNASTYKGSRSVPKRPKSVFRMQFTPKGEENNLKQKKFRASRKESDSRRHDSSGLSSDHTANPISLTPDVSERSSRGSRHKMRFTNLSSKLLNQHNVDRALPNVSDSGSAKKVKRSEVARRIAASVNNAHQKPRIESSSTAGEMQTDAGEAPSSYGVKIVYSQQIGEDDTNRTAQQVVQSGVSEGVDKSFSNLSLAPTSEASVRTAITDVERMLDRDHQFTSESPASAQNNVSEDDTGFAVRVMCNRRFDNSNLHPNSNGEENEVQSASGVSSCASVRLTDHEVEEKLPITIRYSRYEEECREMHPAISMDATSSCANKRQESMQPTSSNTPLDESIVESAHCDPRTVSTEEDVNDSTEQAWDRVELPWEEVSVTLSTDPVLPKSEPRKNRKGLSSWMSRRAKQAMGRKKTTGNGINIQESNGATTDHQEDEASVLLKRKIYRKLKPLAKERLSKEISSPSLSASSSHLPVQVSVINMAPTIVVNKKTESSINKYPQLKVGGQHPRTGAPLNESKTSGSHSARDPYGLQVYSESSQSEEDWYGKYLDDGSTGNSSQIPKPQHSIDSSSQSPAPTIPDSPMSTQSSKLVFLTEVVESETSAIDLSISWESFSNSPFNDENQHHTSQPHASEFSKNLFSDSSTSASQTSEGIRTAKALKTAKAAATVRQKNKTSTKKKVNTSTTIKDMKRRKPPRPDENGETATVKVKAQEFAIQASTGSAQGKETVRDPTPQRSNVSGKDQWEFFNPDREIKKTTSENALSFVGSRARAALADHKLHKDRASMKSSKKRSPSSVAMATSTGHFDDSEFGRPFDVTTSAFDAETSFPPF